MGLALWTHEGVGRANNAISTRPYQVHHPEKKEGGDVESRPGRNENGNKNAEGGGRGQVRIQIWNCEGLNKWTGEEPGGSTVGSGVH